MAQVGAASGVTSCGYTLSGGAPDYTLTGLDLVALANTTAYSNSANCGRCVELVRTAGANTYRVTVTVVGSCDAAQCSGPAALPGFGVTPTALQVLGANPQLQLPLTGETLTYSFVACPAPTNPPILANVRINTGAPGAVLFVRQRYGIKSVTLEDQAVGQPIDLSRGNDNYWATASGVLPGSAPIFRLTDVNNNVIMFSNILLINAPAFASTAVQFPTCTTP
jgi:hypothetical protein